MVQHKSHQEKREPEILRIPKMVGGGSNCASREKIFHKKFFHGIITVRVETWWEGASEMYVRGHQHPLSEKALKEYTDITNINKNLGVKLGRSQ